MRVARVAFVFLKKPHIEPLGVLYLGAVARFCEAEVGYFVGNDPKLQEFAPDYVCYSIMTGDQTAFRDLNHALKTSLKPFISVVGGPHPSFFPETCWWADKICIGEGELWLKGLLLSGNPVPSCIPVHLDGLPFPDRPFNSAIGHFITTRGCPYDCSYCYNSRWHDAIIGGKKIRTRSVENVVREIYKVSPRFVYFQDDCFGISIEWLKNFVNQYGTPIPYHCHVRPEMVTPERVNLLQKSGCKSVHMAIETANEPLRVRLLNRKMRNKDIRKAVNLLHDAGIGVMTQNMIGLPESCIEDDLWTLEFNQELAPEYAWCSIYQPYPGTRLADYCLKKKLWDGDISKIGANFFEKSCLEWKHPDHRRQLAVLQKMFAFYVEHGSHPSSHDLAHNRMSKAMLQEVYDARRREGDIKLFGKEIVDLWK